MKYGLTGSFSMHRFVKVNVISEQPKECLVVLGAHEMSTAQEDFYVNHTLSKLSERLVSPGKGLQHTGSPGDWAAF